MKMKYAVLILGAVELYLTISPGRGGVAHVAHLFGAIAAFVYLKVLRLHAGRNSNRRKTSRQRFKPKHLRNNIPEELMNDYKPTYIDRLIVQERIYEKLNK